MRDRSSRATQTAVRFLLRGATRSILPVKVTDGRRLPAGPVIVAANHLSFFDSIALIGSIARPIALLGKAEYLDSWKTRVLFPACGMIPVDRTNGRAALVALEQGRRVIDDGGVLAVFPEGTRSRDGCLHKGRTGVARLAVAAGVPIVPIGLIGTDRVQAPGRALPRLRVRCEMVVGEPIDAAGFVSDGIGPGSYRRLTDHVMASIAALSGQAYVPEYAEPPVTSSTPPRASVALAF